MDQKLNMLSEELMVNGMKLKYRAEKKVDIVFNSPFGAEMKATASIPEGYVKTISHPYHDPKSTFIWYVKVNNRPARFSA